VVLARWWPGSVGSMRRQHVLGRPCVEAAGGDLREGAWGLPSISLLQHNRRSGVGAGVRRELIDALLAGWVAACLLVTNLIDCVRVAGKKGKERKEKKKRGRRKEKCINTLLLIDAMVHGMDGMMARASFTVAYMRACIPNMTYIPPSPPHGRKSQFSTC